MIASEKWAERQRREKSPIGLQRNLSVPVAIRKELLKSGTERFHNQVQWARQYLVWEGLLDGSKRNLWTLTSRGTQTHLTLQDARAIVKKWLDIYAKVRRQRPLPTGTPDATADLEIAPPDEKDEQELLKVLQKLSSKAFERVCQRLLRASGFEKVIVTGQSHDGGIDGVGILQVNPFVSLKVLFQCKKYKGSVSRGQVGDFATQC